MARTLTKIQALCDAASKGDAMVCSYVCNHSVEVYEGVDGDGEFSTHSIGDFYHRSDDELYAAAREELPRLVKAYQVLSMAVIKTIEGVCETELITNPNLCDGCTVPVPQCKDVRKLATALRSAGITP